MAALPMGGFSGLHLTSKSLGESSSRGTEQWWNMGPFRTQTAAASDYQEIQDKRQEGSLDSEGLEATTRPAPHPTLVSAQVEWGKITIV